MVLAAQHSVGAFPIHLPERSGLLRGFTLDEWLRQRPARIDDDELKLRLGLHRTLCDAVHYAHQRGVIHRDLKPSNIIVTEETASTSGGSSDKGLTTIKILDFGLARITDSDIAATLVSEIGVIKGTLQYMSPEQARGEVAAVDVRSDVYALGVILYEMLTGRRPYDVARAALAEAVRVICEEPPEPLSCSWSGIRRLDRDLETIVGKTLEKEVERRYDSAAALREDVERYLTSQPILARVLLAQGEFEEAEQHALEAQRSARLSYGERSWQTADTYEVLSAIVQDWRSDYQRAGELTRIELEILREIHDGDSIEISMTLNNLAVIEMNMGELAAAEASFRRGLEIATAHHPDDAPTIATHRLALGSVLLQRGHNR